MPAGAGFHFGSSWNEAVIARGGNISGADFVVRTSAAAAINRALKAAAASEGGGGHDHHGHSHD